VCVEGDNWEEERVRKEVEAQRLRVEEEERRVWKRKLRGSCRSKGEKGAES
jgi:hypothetical protein